MPPATSKTSACGYGSLRSQCVRRDDVESCCRRPRKRVLAAHGVRVLPENRPRICERAQGRPGAGWHPWSACSKKARGRTTGSAGATGLPCTMVLRLIRALLGEPGFLATVISGSLRSLSASIGAPGPHDYILDLGETP